ncbi:hypothetical protein HAX54_026789 [Datura stramonium]|uniref:Uncharacterized protein n=1 Tax=Datura stramonium TaxID=4076 RepID=A0ABS8V3R4_DATST|nr:hypothetical protein [Datura stramonium]
MVFTLMTGRLVEEEEVNYRSRALFKVGPSFEEPFEDDDPIENGKIQVDSDVESDADDGEYLEIEEAAYSPTDNAD